MDTPAPHAERPRIKPLPPLVANQIAAGEVVERPASVVKELVENALDAGATRITLELESGGIELVRITDDGRGIEPEDLPLALAPHATSKISDAADLDHIATLGFRGEALASISSVSRLSLRSRTASHDGAMQIDAEGDAISPPRPAAGPVGTCVTVRNLFFNTPARRKFLRTVQTEQERCLDALRALAFAHPATGFMAVCDGRVVIDLPPNQGPRERALALLGKELAEQVVDVHADQFDDSRGIAIWGLAGLPAIARGTSKHLHVFVNGRAVRDKTIQHAIGEAYRGIIEPGRYATIVLMLEMSPAGVDVNVHPAKAEVRFRDSSMVHSVVLCSIRRALQAADVTPTVSMLRPRFDGGLPGAGVGFGGGGGGGEAPVAAPAAGPAEISRFVEYWNRPHAKQTGIDYRAMQETIAAADAPESAPIGPNDAVAANAASGDGSAAPTEPASLAAPGPAARVLQVHKSYLVTQDEQGVVIIDQHALHERVMFEYLLGRITSGGLEKQRLLTPVSVPATRDQVERLDEIREFLDRIGIEAEASGPMSVALSTFPTFLFDRGVDPIEFATELLEKAESRAFAKDLKGGGEEAMRDVLDMMSCKAAVKAGDGLSDLELGELVRLRDAVERSSNCPHGRPTSIRLTIRELEKLFGRG